MAQRVSITLVDDLDGTEASETVLRTRLEEFVAVARKVTGRKRAKKSGPSSKEVRQWAQAQGMEVSTRGVVSAEIVAAYEAAH